MINAIAQRINTSLFIGLLTIFYISNMISVDLKTLYCHQPAKGWSKGKPYLWTLFFSIDSSTIQLTENFRLAGEAFFKFSEGSHGNLDKETVKSGEAVAIPGDMGAGRAAAGASSRNRSCCNR